MTVWLFPGTNCSWTCMPGAYLDSVRGVYFIKSNLVHQDAPSSGPGASRCTKSNLVHQDAPSRITKLILDAPGFCSYCPGGTFKAMESNATLCDPCPVGTYRPTGPSMQQCLIAPPYSTVSVDRADFACNAGYSRSFLGGDVVCASCFSGATSLTQVRLGAS